VALFLHDVDVDLLPILTLLRFPDSPVDPNAAHTRFARPLGQRLGTERTRLARSFQACIKASAVRFGGVNDRFDIQHRRRPARR
jgi:hypothetical protein